jgi:hypothetical protein
MTESYDPVRSQIEPRAHQILNMVDFSVPPGFNLDDHGIPRFSYGPKFTGVPFGVWATLLSRHPQQFWELVSLCEASFPTWCALLGRVVVKGAGAPQPMIFNNPQRVTVARLMKRISERLPLWLIVLKSRQMGITTLISFWHYWQLWRKANVQTLFLGDKVSLLQRQINILRATHDNLPDVGNIKPTLRSDNNSKSGTIPKYELYFTRRGTRSWNSGGITVVAKNPSSVLGFQSTHCSCSEAAFWGDKGDILQLILDALLPQLPPPSSPNYLESSMIVESTPQGMNDFRDLYWENRDDKLDAKWSTIVLPWFIHDEEYFQPVPPDFEFTVDERQEQQRCTKMRLRLDGKPVTDEQMYWRHNTIRDQYDGSVDTFNEWYISDDDTCFRAGDGSVFKSDATYLHESVEIMEKQSHDLLAQANLRPDPGMDYLAGSLSFDDMPTPFGRGSRLPDNNTKALVEFVRNPKGQLRIWEPPQRGHIYTIGGDCSGGTGNDGACAHIACVTCGQQAGELYNNWLDPNGFADQCVHLGWWYNNALFNPEVNQLGSAVLKRAMSDWNYGHMCQEENWDEARLKPNKYGFSSGEHSKPVMINYARGMITNRHYRIASRRLLREMSNFYYLGLTSYGQQKTGGGRSGTAHDDTVLAWALAMWAVRQTPPGLRADFESRRYRAPSAVELGMNRTQPDLTFLGKTLNSDPYGDDGVPQSITNLFEIDGFGQDQYSAACPMSVGWQGYE